MQSVRVGRLGVVVCALGWGLLTGGNAWAVNKCVGADGRISFQDAPCAAGQTSSEVDVAPSSQGITPTDGSKPRPAGSVHTPPSAPVQSGVQDRGRPDDCPSVEAMQKLQVEAESVALPLPIRNQKLRDFEALKQRCG